MLILHRMMVIEHPAEPEASDESWLPSIWRLKSVKLLAQHPAVQHLRVLQGLFGGLSPKPTSLLLLVGDLRAADIINRFAVTELPAALQMGFRDREYVTSALKEYPELLCQALAEVASEWCRKYIKEPTVGTTTSMDDFLTFADCLRQSLNEDALRGPDCAICVF